MHSTDNPTSTTLGLCSILPWPGGPHNQLRQAVQLGKRAPTHAERQQNGTVRSEGNIPGLTEDY